MFLRKRQNMRHGWVLGFGLWGAVGLAGISAAKPPPVVASLRPLHSLAAGVMEGAGRPALLMKGSASPHRYSLRPSQVRSLTRARIVFWAGAALEPYLVRPLAVRSRAGPSLRAVALFRAAGVNLLPARPGGLRPAPV